MKNFLLGFVFISFLIAPVQAANENDKDVFTQANQAYEKGEWNKAYDLYQSLVRKGFGGADLAYNLGNVHYKRGERGQAVLWYERAKREAPRDNDIQFNLGLARAHIKEDGESLFQKIVMTFTVGELTGAFLAFIWIFFGLLALMILGQIRGDLWPPAFLWLSGILVLTSGAWLSLNYRWAHQPMGVVITPPGEVRNGPGTDYAVGFTIPEGSKVLILNSRPEWIQVGVSEQGLKGWMPQQQIENIAWPGGLIPAA